MMVDIFCGLLTGMPTGDEVSDMFNDRFFQKRYLGQFYSAIRIDAFEEPTHFKKRLQDLADRIRRQPRQDPDTPVLIPGDPEKAHQADREANGIPINPGVLAVIETIAGELQIEPFW